MIEVVKWHRSPLSIHNALSTERHRQDCTHVLRTLPDNNGFGSLALSYLRCFSLFQVRTLFVSGLPMDAKPRELYLLFRAYEVSAAAATGVVDTDQVVYAP